MKLSFCYFMYFLCFLLTLTHMSFASFQPQCHDEERSFLWQFKESFVINKSASYSTGAYPTFEWWEIEGDQNSNCCSWDGIECDEETGHVISIDLSSSCIYGSFHSNSTLFRLVHLQSLNLSDNDFNYSRIPASIGQLSSLTHLNLSNSQFSSQIPERIFQLPNLKLLALDSNPELYGQLPESNMSTSLEELRLNSVPLSGNLSAIANLVSLTILDVGNCSLSGQLPSSLANLTQLKYLDLSHNSFTGHVSSSLSNLIELEHLMLDQNFFSDKTLHWVGNLTKLVKLSLAYNKFQGSFPKLLSNLMNLEYLDLAANELIGLVDFNIFIPLKNLYYLELSDNMLTFLTETSYSNASLPRLKVLGLGSCNLNQFPDFLRYQDQLEFLQLGANNIRGRIPKWMLNTSVNTLEFMDLSENFLTGFEEPPSILPWVSLQVLIIANNRFEGPVPIPQTSVILYNADTNSLTTIPSLICNLTSLQALGLGENHLSGKIPECLGYFKSLKGLSLHNNLFHDSIPDTFSNGSSLQMIRLRHNQFQGHVPQSFANCLDLRTLDLGHNKLSGVFPSWLGTLMELRVLVLHYNKFHGSIKESKTNFLFPKLRIIDLSHNNFNGFPPFKYLINWDAMKAVNSDPSSYIVWTASFKFPNLNWEVSRLSWVEISTKGVERNYTKSLVVFKCIDFSSNRFEGKIPEIIGNLQGLQSLNLSNNMLTGNIPFSLGNMTALESLDLSYNKLSGEIPQQLARLTFLEVFSVSHNNLTGLIPQGNQLNTFENLSYMGNSGLCGKPLSKSCWLSDLKPPRTTSEKEQNQTEKGSFFEFGWKIVVIGYGCGVVVGIIVGNYVVGLKQEWLLRTFKIAQPKWRR